MASERPFLRFFHSAALRKKTLAVLDALEADAEPKRHAADLAEIVLGLTESGLESYFLEPLRAAKGGILAEKTTGLAVAAMLRTMRPIARGVLGAMDGTQLRSVARSIRRMME